MSEELCPCGSGRPLESCCGVFLSHQALPETAEQLMRSRYTAYAKQQIGYLKDTLWPKYQPGFDSFSTAKWASENRWVGLSVLRTEKGGPTDREGMVLFEARYLSLGQLQTHRELSRFRKKSGRWYYVEASPEA